MVSVVNNRWQEITKGNESGYQFDTTGLSSSAQEMLLHQLEADGYTAHIIGASAGGSKLRVYESENPNFQEFEAYAATFQAQELVEKHPLIGEDGQPTEYFKEFVQNTNDSLERAARGADQGRPHYQAQHIDKLRSLAQDTMLLVEETQQSGNLDIKQAFDKVTRETSGIYQVQGMQSFKAVIDTYIIDNAAELSPQQVHKLVKISDSLEHASQNFEDASFRYKVHPSFDVDPKTGMKIINPKTGERVVEIVPPSQEQKDAYVEKHIEALNKHGEVTIASGYSHHANYATIKQVGDEYHYTFYDAGAESLPTAHINREDGLPQLKGVSVTEHKIKVSDVQGQNNVHDLIAALVEKKYTEASAKDEFGNQITGKKSPEFQAAKDKIASLIDETPVRVTETPLQRIGNCTVKGQMLYVADVLQGEKINGKPLIKNLVDDLRDRDKSLGVLREQVAAVNQELSPVIGKMLVENPHRMDEAGKVFTYAGAQRDVDLLKDRFDTLGIAYHEGSMGLYNAITIDDPASFDKANAMFKDEIAKHNNLTQKKSTPQRVFELEDTFIGSDVIDVEKTARAQELLHEKGRSGEMKIIGETVGKQVLSVTGSEADIEAIQYAFGSENITSRIGKDGKLYVMGADNFDKAQDYIKSVEVIRSETTGIDTQTKNAASLDDLLLQKQSDSQIHTIDFKGEQYTLIAVTESERETMAASLRQAGIEVSDQKMRDGSVTLRIDNNSIEQFNNLVDNAKLKVSAGTDVDPTITEKPIIEDVLREKSTSRQIHKMESNGREFTLINVTDSERTELQATLKEAGIEAVDQKLQDGRTILRVRTGSVEAFDALVEQSVNGKRASQSEQTTDIDASKQHNSGIDDILREKANSNQIHTVQSNGRDYKLIAVTDDERADMQAALKEAGIETVNQKVQDGRTILRVRTGSVEAFDALVEQSVNGRSTSQSEQTTDIDASKQNKPGIEDIIREKSTSKQIQTFHSNGRDYKLIAVNDGERAELQASLKEAGIEVVDQKMRNGSTMLRVRTGSLEAFDALVEQSLNAGTATQGKEADGTSRTNDLLKEKYGQNKIRTIDFKGESFTLINVAEGERAELADALQKAGIQVSDQKMSNGSISLRVDNGSVDAFNTLVNNAVGTTVNRAPGESADIVSETDAARIALEEQLSIDVPNATNVPDVSAETTATVPDIDTPQQQTGNGKPSVDVGGITKAGKYVEGAGGAIGIATTVADLASGKELDGTDVALNSASIVSDGADVYNSVSSASKSTVASVGDDVTAAAGKVVGSTADDALKGAGNVALNTVDDAARLANVSKVLGKAALPLAAAITVKQAADADSGKERTGIITGFGTSVLAAAGAGALYGSVVPGAGTAFGTAGGIVVGVGAGIAGQFVGKEAGESLYDEVISKLPPEHQATPLALSHVISEKESEALTTRSDKIEQLGNEVIEQAKQHIRETNDAPDGRNAGRGKEYIEQMNRLDNPETRVIEAADILLSSGDSKKEALAKELLDNAEALTQQVEQLETKYADEMTVLKQQIEQAAKEGRQVSDLEKENIVDSVRDQQANTIANTGHATEAGKLAADGVMTEAIARAAQSPTLSNDLIGAGLNSSGEQIAALQAALDMPESQRDGVFGELETLPALNAFREQHGLPIGSATLTAEDIAVLNVREAAREIEGSRDINFTNADFAQAAQGERWQDAINNNAPASSEHSPQTVTVNGEALAYLGLKHGAGSVQDVKALQEALGMTGAAIDGDFGDATLAAFNEARTAAGKSPVGRDHIITADDATMIQELKEARGNEVESEIAADASLNGTAAVNASLDEILEHARSAPTISSDLVGIDAGETSAHLSQVQEIIGAEQGAFNEETLEKLEEFRDKHDIDSNAQSITQTDVNMMNALKAAQAVDFKNDDIAFTDSDFASAVSALPSGNKVEKNDPAYSSR